MMMTMSIRRSPIRSLSLGLILAAAAASLSAGEPPTVHDAWARATPPGVDTGAVYLTVVGGTEPDRLIGARTSAAAMAQLHTEKRTAGVVTMKKLDALAVPAGAHVDLAPGGSHVMLLGLKGPLKPGQTIGLTLLFEHAGNIEVSVPVRDARSSVPEAHHGHSEP